MTSIWQLAGWFFHVVGRSLMLPTSASMSPVSGVEADRDVRHHARVVGVARGGQQLFLDNRQQVAGVHAAARHRAAKDRLHRFARLGGGKHRPTVGMGQLVGNHVDDAVSQFPHRFGVHRQRFIVRQGLNLRPLSRIFHHVVLIRFWKFILTPISMLPATMTSLSSPSTVRNKPGIRQ